jgi:hypothetical protein
MRGSRLAACLAALLPAFVGCSVADLAAEDALRATARVYRGSVSGTGFFVDAGEKGGPPRLLLATAAHVFENIPGPECTVALRVRAADGTFSRKELTLAIREGEKRLWTRHPDADVAAIPITPPAGVDLKPFPYRRVADESWAATGKLRVGQDVVVPCFPAKLEANPAGWPVLRKGSVASHPLTPLSAAKTMLVDYSHFGGDSGSPVVTVGPEGPAVVAVVVAMQRQTDRVTMPFEERTVHTPLGLAVTVPSPFLRQAVDSLLKARP